jgi:WD40 repeat protein
LAEAEQVQLGLAPTPPPDETNFVGFAWQSGWFDLSSGSHLDSFLYRDTTAPGMNVARAFVAFVRDTYAERGEHALLEIARPAGQFEARLAEALGTTPEALNRAWLRYGQAHWSNTAGRPAPQGELTVICNVNHAIQLYDPASGSTRELAVFPFEILSVSWSADGEWLGIAARSDNADFYTIMGLGAISWGLGGRGQFIGWAPDGRHFALYRPFAQNQTVVLDLDIVRQIPDSFADPPPPSSPEEMLTRAQAHVLPDVPASLVWSPTGDKLAYVAGDATIWVADGDGSNARSVARGLLPVWSPDSRSLAYLLPDSLFQPAPELVVMDVESGAVRSVLNVSALSGDELIAAPLIVPGVSLESLQAAAIYDVACSPDGSQLVARVALWNASSNSLMAIVTVSPDGRERQVWMVGGGVEKLSWSPDGKRLTLISRPSVWVITLDPFDFRSVVAADYSWSPDGQWLAVEQEMGPAIFSADLQAVWRLSLAGCRVGAWRPER